MPGIIGALLTAAFSAAPAGGQSFTNWPQYLYSPGHNSDNAAATAITPANAAHAQLLWTFNPPPGPLTGLTGFLSSPTVYNGVLYIGAKNGYFYAINEATGSVIWQRFIGYIPKMTCPWSQGFVSTATVEPDPASGQPTVYAYGANGYLYAMNAATGTDVWPPALVYTPSKTKNNYFAWDSPLVDYGQIYVGISSNCDNPLVRAGLDDFSQTTGALETTYWTTPPGSNGASVWSSPATDGTSIFITTGNSPAEHSEGYSIIKLNPGLSKTEGIWSVPKAARVNDSDFGGSPSIWTASIGGTPTEMTGACNKNGNFYAFRADDLGAGPVWTDDIGDPPGKGVGLCIAAAVFAGSKLYLASNAVTIGGTAYNGSVMRADPATGAIIWRTPVSGAVMGTPSIDGKGVIAADSYSSKTGQNGLWLINAATGAVLRTFAYGKSQTFGQPVFADNYLFTASTTDGLQAYTAG